MKFKRKFGLACIFMGILFILLYSFSITGAVIGIPANYQQISFFVGLSLIIVGALMFIFKKPKLEEVMAKSAFWDIHRFGVDGLSTGAKRELKYGLDNELYTQEDINREQGKFEAYKTRYMQKEAMTAFKEIPIRGEASMSNQERKFLRYGLANRMYSRKDIHEQQKEYKENTKKIGFKLLRFIEEAVR